jgi:peptidoglycan/LPS O-acetylase OafA/YrhL
VDGSGGAEGAVPPERPLLLRLATVGVALEALALLAFGAWLGVETLVETPDNIDIARGSTAYFLLLGALVTLIAVALARGRAWSLGAGTFVQLLALPLAWYMAQGGLWVGAVPLAALAVVTLAGLVGERSRAAVDG